MKFFDSHIHFFERPYSDIFKNSHIKEGEKGEFSLYNEYRKEFDIIGAFVIAYEDKRWPENNRYVAHLARKNKWIYPFGHIRREKGDFLGQAKRFISMGYFGVSLYLDKVDDGGWLYSENMKPYWEHLKENKIPMSINMKASQTRALLRVAEKYPAQIFLLSHMVRPIINGGKLNRRAYEPVLSLAEFSNIHIKISGFYAFVKDGWRYPQRELFQTIDILKKNFGAKRLIWGSDFSPVLEFNTFRQSFEIINTEYHGFNEEELKSIFYKNSLEIIRRRKGWIRQFTVT